MIKENFHQKRNVERSVLLLGVFGERINHTFGQISEKSESYT